MVPSSPGLPCSRLSATSGFTSASLEATARSTSIRVTRKPARSAASAQALPDRSEISRSADQPPIKTATCLDIQNSRLATFTDRWRPDVAKFGEPQKMKRENTSEHVLKIA